MNVRIVALILLVVFTAYTAYTMVRAEESLLAFAQRLVSSPDTAQVVFDLYIMAFLAILWMFSAAKRAGKSVLYLIPFVLLTLVFVSIGPLLYIVLNGVSHEPKPELT